VFQQIKFRLKLQNQTIGIKESHGSSRHEAKYYNIALRVSGSVQASDRVVWIGAGRVRDSKTCAFDATSI